LGAECVLLGYSGLLGAGDFLGVGHFRELHRSATAPRPRSPHIKGLPYNLLTHGGGRPEAHARVPPTLAHLPG
jgi:hypothetical protein